MIKVDITRGNLNPLPIAVSALSADKKTNEELNKDIKIKNLGIEISKVVENNQKIQDYLTLWTLMLFFKNQMLLI